MTTNHSVLPAGYTFRAGRREDAPAYYKLLCAVEAADKRERLLSLAECYREYDDPDAKPETHSLAVFAANGEMIAHGWLYVPMHAEREQVAQMWGDVHPAHRRRGLGTFILNWQEQRAREILNALPNELPRGLRVSAGESSRDRLDFFTRHGYDAVRYFFRMRRDLSQPLPEAKPIDGIAIRAWAPELDSGMMRAFNASFRDHWGFEPITDEQWQVFFSASPIFRPEATFAALAGAEVVGFSFCSVNADENALIGFKQGMIRDVGTVRAWRKRGVASTLMGHSMRVFQAQGLDYAVLGVDAENPTGALAIYERLGFRVAQKNIALGKGI